jgi:uncharacterized membrane protein YgcG
MNRASSADTLKWAKANLAMGVCLLVGAAVLTGVAIYGASQKTQSDVEQGVAAAQILCIVVAGALAIAAYRLRRKLVVYLNAAVLLLLTLVVLVLLIVLLAGPTAAVTEQMVDAECMLRNLQTEQCDIVKRFTLTGVYVVQVVTLLYCVCYLAVALLYVRAFRRDSATATAHISSSSNSGGGESGTGGSDADGFDDFPAADNVPMLSVSANVI